MTLQRVAVAYSHRHMRGIANCQNRGTERLSRGSVDGSI